MVISGFQALREAGAPVAGLEPATGGPLQISGRTRGDIKVRFRCEQDLVPGVKAVNMARPERIPDDISKLTTPIPLSEEVLQMAKEARNDQGIHETEVSFCGEAGLHESLHSCEKNPGHSNFLPITELTFEGLPKCLQYKDVAEFIVKKAAETVRLTCSYTSPARPDNYCFSKYRGKDGLTRYGSGRVWSVHADKVRCDIPCPFKDCTEGQPGSSETNESRTDCKMEQGNREKQSTHTEQQNFIHDKRPLSNNGDRIPVEKKGAESCDSSSEAEASGMDAKSKENEANNLVDRKDGKKNEEECSANVEEGNVDLDPQPPDNTHFVSGYFRIHTAKHVVFDDAEACRTTVEFFYDDHRDVRNVIRARGLRVARSDIAGDYCVMDCVSHDPNLGFILDRVRREWSQMWLQVKDKIYGHDVSVVVSHPHGCSKQFSTGQCLNRNWGETPEGQGWYRYSYDAPTCPGSSGAPVWVPGRDGLFSGYAPHSGAYGANVACSAVWFFWDLKKDK
ncbi:hypothetical protein PoB_001285700 [Plakobranchus ocellatus]|uniref:Uncharacterized protein n=1 Tax=Plakobranchus ocellatus TaxID=259542 RepID=A0AAV3YV45_9GAST|nr:hypothetical protein PoB_001285700 [Plakobranchus ocellatus]